MGALLDELKENEIKRFDYVGFTYNGIHSSQLNILSVSDGSRYHMDLLPTLEDYSTDIVGGIGANYFGGSYKKREFTLNIAYDRVEEQHFRAMREWLGDREIHELYFDECPYKVYNAVVSKTPTFKYVAFGDVGTRVYKGEGTIVFTCYDPIGYSKIGNYLDDYDYENIEEWALASNMLYNKNKKDNGTIIPDYYDTPINGNIHAYNAGELPTPFRLKLDWDSTELIINNVTTEKILKLKRTSSENITILIDTERSLAIQLFDDKEYRIVKEDEEENVEDSEGNETDENENNDGQETDGETTDEEAEIDAEGRKEYVILNQLVEKGRFFTLATGLNELSVTGATITDFQFYHRYL